MGSLVKMSVGHGKFWQPRMSAASYNLHETSFGIEQIYLDDQRDVSYDVTCEISMAVCKSTPNSLCDAVTNSEAISFGDAFDGDINIPSSRRRLGHGFSIRWDQSLKEILENWEAYKEPQDHTSTWFMTHVVQDRLLRGRRLLLVKTSSVGRSGWNVVRH